VVQRQPFPGPGLAIRILCADKPYLTDAFEGLNQDIHQQAQSLNMQGNVLPVKSVGVQGDYRTYSYLALLSGDYPQNWEAIRALAQQIPNRYHEINRVALMLNKDIQLPKIITEVTPTTLTPDCISLLRQIDFDVTEAFRKANCLSGVSQLLSVLVPVGLQPGGRSIAIRAVVTSDYMTARPARLGEEMPWDFMETLAQQLTQTYPIDWVMYDVTSKPPATVEWE
jgi:GMP synthase (glutamine-hydrolysing)